VTEIRSSEGGVTLLSHHERAQEKEPVAFATGSSVKQI
jgi:hypothetical protein